LERRLVARELVHELRELEDRVLAARREVVDLARLSAQGAGHEAARDVGHVDEVARRDAALVELERLALERPPDEGRRDVPPDGRRRATPAARAEDLARAVDVLEARADGRHLVLLVEVDRV